MSRLDSSSSAELRARRRRWAALGLGEIAGAVAARMRALEIVTRRLDDHLTTFGKELEQARPEVIRCIEEGAAYTAKNRDLAYELLVDIDALLFECRSAYELTSRFAGEFLSGMLDVDVPRNRHNVPPPGWLEDQISRHGGPTSWIEELRTNRNEFTHATAPWPAIEITSVSPFQAELVLLKKNVVDLSDSGTYLHIDGCRRIYSEFLSVLPIFETWLIDEIVNFEARAQPR